MYVKNIQIFLKFANFYQCFINKYTQMITLLSNLTRGAHKRQKTPVFLFDEKIYVIFKELKK